MPSAQGLVIC